MMYIFLFCKEKYRCPRFHFDGVTKQKTNIKLDCNLCQLSEQLWLLI